uniref:PLAC domain-containing protein n=1 Tax=Clastoptera arizonana TaxID=38151 RepID=A0A1B6CQ79_9HEMI
MLSQTYSFRFLLLVVILHVGCDGVVGSDKHVDTCGVCGGDNSTCRIISGIFTRPQLPVGYNLITQLPQSACNLSITELKQSRNYLALRRPDGSFILNGNWAINYSGEYNAAGSKFFYMREEENNVESISSPGPLMEPLDLMLIYQQPNPGIKYQYQLPTLASDAPLYPVNDEAAAAPPLLRHSSGLVPPVLEQGLTDNGIDTKSKYNKHMFPYGVETPGYSGDEALKPRVKPKKRKVSWKITGYTECSKSCGGGVQTPIFSCIREHNQMIVPERRCITIEKPLQKTRCNVKPCVAEWVGGDWSGCSVSCGEGVQTREIICRQEISPTLIMTVAEGACLTPPPPHLHKTRVCHEPPCSGVPYTHGQWVAGAWSQCSVECGLGIRTRSVACPSGSCPMSDRPTTESVCDMGDCQPQANEPHSSSWFYTEWSHECSEGCGTGIQTRKVHCSGPEHQCDASSKPESTRACSSDKHCGGQWYTGPWGQCSVSCGPGKRSRSVVCVTKHREGQGGEQVITTDNHCLGSEKPSLEQQCNLKSCGAEWYSTDWSQCSRTCDSGVQRREVKCLDDNQVLSNDCSEELKPLTRKTCTTRHCHVADEPVSSSASKQPQVTTVAPAGETPGDQAQHASEEDDECVDRFHNCHLVVQARLCKYKYYRGSCCLACRSKA